MRFAILSILALLPTLFAAPVQTTELKIRDAQSDNIAAAVSNTENLGSSLQSIFARIKSDPLTSLSVYVDNSHTTTYNIPKELSSAFGTAINGIVALPELTNSNDPTKIILSDFGPLVKTVTLTLFYSTIDLKLLSQDTIGPFIPGYKQFTNDLDANTFNYVKALDAQYVGFIDQLATAVGKDTPIGIALKALGGQTFYLIFDHISAH